MPGNHDEAYEEGLRIAKEAGKCNSENWATGYAVGWGNGWNSGVRMLQVGSTRFSYVTPNHWLLGNDDYKEGYKEGYKKGEGGGKYAKQQFDYGNSISYTPSKSSYDRGYEDGYYDGRNG